MHASPSTSELALAARVPGRRRRARDEATLVKQAKRGSADAVEALVRLHWDGAHRTAYLIVRDATAAEDIAQESLLAAVRRIGDFDRGRPFRPWLHRIVVNRSLDWVRARERRGEVSADALEPVAAPPDPEPAGDLMAALGALAPEERALIVLRHLHGYRSSELARLLGLPAATVRTRLARALQRLGALAGEERR